MKLKGYVDILRLEYCFRTKSYIFRMVCKEALLFTLGTYLKITKCVRNLIEPDSGTVYLYFIYVYTRYYCTYIFGNITVSNYKECGQNRVCS